MLTESDTAYSTKTSKNLERETRQRVSGKMLNLEKIQNKYTQMTDFFYTNEGSKSKMFFNVLVTSKSIVNFV